MLKNHHPLLIFLLIITGNLSCLSLNSEFLGAINDILSRYTRPFTVVEIGLTDADYLVHVAQHDRYKSSYIALLIEDGQSFTEQVKYNQLKNIVVLNPKRIRAKDFSIFSHCEHIDVVIIHDLSPILKSEFPKSLKSILNLGEHNFIILNEKNISIISEGVKRNKVEIITREDENILCYHYRSKNRLVLHRWNSEDKPYKQKEYNVTSTFKEKYLIKTKQSNVKLNWEPGINLKTFIMLYGIYPTDSIISNEINAMRYSVPYHGDLTIPNMVIQGHSVIPIDISKNGKKEKVENYIKTAIKCMFNGDNERLRDPEASFSWYGKVKDSIRKEVAL